MAHIYTSRKKSRLHIPSILKYVWKPTFVAVFTLYDLESTANRFNIGRHVT